MMTSLQIILLSTAMLETDEEDGELHSTWRQCDIILCTLENSVFVSMSPAELLPGWSGLHSEEEESVSGWFASPEQRRRQTELQTQSSLQ